MSATSSELQTSAAEAANEYVRLHRVCGREGRRSARVSARRKSYGCLLLLSAFFVSCHEKSSPDKINAEAQTILSWSATAQMVGEEWSHGAIGDAYARRTLEAAIETFEHETETLNELSDAPTEQRAEYLDRLAKLRQSALQMRQGIEQHARERVAAEIERLKVENEALRAAPQKSGES